MTPSRLAALSACILAATALSGCSTSGVSATDLLTLAPVPAAPVVVDAPEEPAAAPSVSLAAVATDAAKLAGDAAKAAAEVVKGVADAPTTVAVAPQPAPDAARPAEPEPVANAFVETAATKPAVEVAFAPPNVHGPDERAKLDRLISHYADVYDVPKDLVHRVVRRESNYRPTAHNSGNWGLMQIRHATAKGMGYDGKAEGLLDAETNLRYAVRYLRGAYVVAGGDKDHAIRLYSRGYYYDAKRAGLLDETGLGRDRVRRRQPG